MYQQEDPSPPVRPVPTHVTFSNIDDETPTKVDIKAEVSWLSINRSGGHTHLRAEHIQQ